MSSKVTIEQVEKLQQRANVSYEEAKEALEKCDGDILEALIALEKEGKTTQPGGGSYSTNGTYSANGMYNTNEQAGQSGPQMNYNGGQQESNFNRQAKSIWQSFLDLLHKGNINHFVVSKNGEEVVRMPVTLFIILLIIFNGAALIALIVFLFLGFKYSFDGPNLGKKTINSVMDSASNVAEDIKQNVKNSTASDQNRDNEPKDQGPDNQ